MPTEHRKSSRKIFRTATAISLASGQTYLSRSYDLGIGGMSVVTPVQLETNGQCTISFELPAAARKFSAVARIVYSIPCAEGFKNGLQFADLTPADVQALRDILGQNA